MLPFRTSAPFAIFLLTKLTQWPYKLDFLRWTEAQYLAVQPVAPLCFYWIDYPPPPSTLRSRQRPVDKLSLCWTRTAALHGIEPFLSLLTGLECHPKEWSVLLVYYSPLQDFQGYPGASLVVEIVQIWTYSIRTAHPMFRADYCSIPQFGSWVFSQGLGSVCFCRILLGPSK